LALRTRILAAKSWGELLERAKGFRELWSEAERHLELTAKYLATAALILGEYLVYLAASGDKRGRRGVVERVAVVAGLRPGGLCGYSAYA
jgi:hypothetical protein